MTQIKDDQQTHRTEQHDRDRQLPQVRDIQPQQQHDAQEQAPAPPVLCEQPLPADGNPLMAQIIEALQKVYDPEIPVSIYELGLIYDIDIDPSNAVHINMTLTSPACPVAEQLPLDVRASIESIPEVASAEVDIVFDPPWSPEKMSEVAKVKLGMF